MQPISFPGAVEIKKPEGMTDEEDRVFAFTQCWKPSYEDMQAFNRGEGVYVRFYWPRLAPVSLFTLDEKGECNDAV